MQDRGALEEELTALSAAVRQRRSVDLFLRAALGAFSWILVTGVCAKLLWDSKRTPIFFWALAGLDLFVAWDAVRSFRAARANLTRELRLEARVRELRDALGVDA
jgi:hypothetical protein